MASPRPGITSLFFCWLAAFLSPLLVMGESNPAANLRDLGVAAQDVVYEPITKQTIVATAESNGVTRIAPLSTNGLGPILFEGTDSAVLEADGAGGIYAAFNGSHSVVRHDLATGTSAPPFGVDPATAVTRLTMVASNLLAVSRREINGHGFDTVLYRDGVPLPDIVPWTDVQAVAPDGQHVYSTIGGLHKLRVTPKGLESTGFDPSGVQGFAPNISVVADQILLGTGEVLDLNFDPLPDFRALRWPQRTSYGVVYPDPRPGFGMGRAAFVSQINSAQGFHLFDISTRSSLAHLELPIGGVVEIFPLGDAGFGVRLGWDPALYQVEFDTTTSSDPGLSIDWPAGPLAHGETFRFSITVTNAGAPATNVIVSDTLLNGLVLKSWSPSTGNVDIWWNEITWTIPLLNTGETPTLELEVQAAGIQNALNRAEVKHVGLDANPGNNIVTNQAPIEAAYTGGPRSYHFPAMDIVADKERGTIFATVLSENSPFQNTLVRIRPENNELNVLATFPHPPNQLALSETGRYLWVALPHSGEVEQIDLLGDTPARRFPSGYPQMLGEIDSVPGLEGSVVVASSLGARIFDHGLARSNSAPGGGVAVLSPERAVQYDSATYRLRELTFAADGIHSREYTNQPAQGEISLFAAGGRIFTGSGLVLDPAEGALIQHLAVGLQPLFAADESLDELYILSHDSVTWRFSKFRLSTLAKLAELPVPSPETTPKRLVKWGPRRYAFQTDNFLHVFDEANLGEADLALTGTVVQPASATSSNLFTWRLTLANRGPDSATNVTVSAAFSGPGRFDSASDSPTATLPNPFVRRFPLLRSGQTETIELTVSADSGGLFDLAARLEAFGMDPNYNNNAAQEFLSLEPAAGLIRSYRLPINDIDFDKSTGNLLMTTPAAESAGSFASGLVSLELKDFSLGKVLSLSNAPGILATTDASDHGYVSLDSRPARFELQQPSLLRIDSEPQTSLFDIVPQPGSTNVFATTEFAGVMLYTNGAGAILTDQRGAIAFASDRPELLFHQKENSVIDRYRLGTPNVLEATGQWPFPQVMAMEAVNGRIVFADGQIADAESFELLGRLPGVASSQPPGLIAQDASTKRLYLYFRGDWTDTLAIFSTTDFQRIGQIDFPSIQIPIRMRAFGDFVAILDHTQRLFTEMNVRLLRIPGMNEASLAAAIAPIQAMEGRSVSVPVETINRGPWLASNVVLEVALPANFVLERVESQGQSQISGQSVRVTFVALSPAFTNRVALVGTFRGTNGPGSISATVSSPAVDPLPGDNTATASVSVVPPPLVIASDITVLEGNNTANSVPLRFLLSHPAPLFTSFTLALTNGSGKVEDLLNRASNLVHVIQFPPGRTQAENHIFFTRPNTVSNATQTLLVNLFNPSNLVLLRTNLTIRVLDDDSIPIVSLNSPSQGVQLTEAETDRMAGISLRTSRPPAAEGRVRYRAISESAIEGVDFVVGEGTLTFKTGALATASIPVQILADRLREGRESFRVELLDPENVELAQTSIAVTLNDLAQPSATIVAARLREGRFVARFTTRQLQRYRLLRAPSVDSANWLSVGDEALFDPSGLAELADPEPATHSGQFYRIARSGHNSAVAIPGEVSSVTRKEPTRSHAGSLEFHF